MKADEAVRAIGAGLGRTGTNSLKIALERLLDGPCYHMFEVLHRPDDVAIWHDATDGADVDWVQFFDGWEAAVDFPVAPLFDQIAAAFPDAPVILSTRPGADWYASASATIFGAARVTAGEDPGPLRTMVRAQFARWLGADLDDAEATIAAFDAHNERVRATIPSDRLIEWQPGDGWGPLCAGLEIAVPDEPFPHANSGEDFASTVSAARRGEIVRGHQRRYGP